MAKLVDNVSIKNKIIFGLLLTLFVSLGIGILQFNKILQIQSNYLGRKVLNSYRFDFTKLQNLYYSLDGLVIKLANSQDIEYFNKSVSEFKKVDTEIDFILRDIELIDIKDIKNKETVLFLSTFNDSIFKFQSEYNENIRVSIEKIIDYRILTFNPQRVADDYKRLLAEQQKIDVTFSVKSESILNKDEIVKVLVNTYTKSISSLSNYIGKKINNQVVSLDKLGNYIQDKIVTEEAAISNLKKETIRTSAIFLFLGIVLILIISFMISDSIVVPLKETNETILSLSKGNFPSNISLNRADEIGIIRDSIAVLVSHLKNTAEFARAIAIGNFEYNYNPAGDNDILGNSLLQLRQSLIVAKNEEIKRKTEDEIRRRNAEGLTIFSDILRQNQNNLKKLGSEVISHLVKFINANQGVIFLLNDEDEDNQFLELLSAYAWNREKYLEKRVPLGDGIVGAVAIEKFTVYMTDVPEDYIEIKSGTGSANPKSIIVVPLKVDNQVLGVIELAGFQTFEQYEIELVEKIAEDIASTLKSVRITAQTSELLEKFQIQASEMKEQEFAMRSTIDDLKLSQDEKKKNEDSLKTYIREMEELNKQIQFKDEQLKKEVLNLTRENDQKVKLIEQKEKQSREILQTMLTGVFIIKRQGIIEFINKSVEELLSYDEMELLGVDIERFFESPADIGNKKLCEYLYSNVNKFKEKGGKELFIKTKDGKPKKVVVEIMILAAELEEEMRMVIFVKDTERFDKKQEFNQDFINKLIVSDFQKMMQLEYYEDYISNNKIQVPKFNIESESLIKWSKKYELGVDLIDNQHKRWIDFINNVYLGIITNADKSALQSTFKKLLDYTDYHFGFEEKYMKEFSFEEFDGHHIMHEKFVSNVVTIFTQFIEGRTDSAYNLIIFLKNWIVEHILVSDKKYVELFKKHGIR